VSDISHQTYEDLERQAQDRRYARMRVGRSPRKAAI
jgi:hypothetical protein